MRRHDIALEGPLVTLMPRFFLGAYVDLHRMTSV